MLVILYVDETENENYFIVAGLLTESKAITDLAYKHFKKKLKSMKLSQKTRQKICLEFKSYLLDRHYQKIKLTMLKEINQLNHKIIYSCYHKKDTYFNQDMKEKVYIKLLNNIVASINEPIEIIFDTFNKKDFEQKIIQDISKNSHVMKIKDSDSRMEAGLQFIDNLCSVIRISKKETNYDFYQLIKHNSIEIL